MENFIHKLPKCEQHVHIEGTLTPHRRFACAQKNGIIIDGITSAEQLEALNYPKTYGYEEDEDATLCLQEFLANYYAAMEVLITEDDFADMAQDYADHARAMNVRYAEVFFDPQAHTNRGISFETVMKGLSRVRASELARPDGVRMSYILCFLRDLSVESAEATLSAAEPFVKNLIAVGLDSDELNNPPTKFASVFARARQLGLKITAHCDVDQPDTHAHIKYVATELGGARVGFSSGPSSPFDLVPTLPAGADRIDHGLNIADKPELIELIKSANLGLTLCPMGYIRSAGSDRVFKSLNTIVKAGIPFSLNSDDPAYMTRYVEGVIVSVQKHTGWTAEQIANIQRNTIKMAWTDKAFKIAFLSEIDDLLKNSI
ncbi:hypothetical protein V1511DRAFT_522073 [Dipodascopsis uninucleata]